MKSLTESQILWTLLALGCLLLVARAGGELARRLRQPEVLGELLGGFVLGPSILGVLLPHVRSTLFTGPATAQILSGLSWIGAIFLLLIAGMEVDVTILKANARRALIIAALVSVPSIGAGIMFIRLTSGAFGTDAFFLGTVLSVTAVTVAAKILVERRETRRDFAQLILAAGVTTEVLVWLLVAAESPAHGASPWLMAGEHAALALGFFAFVYFVGRPMVFWLMRRVGDFSVIANGQFTLILVLTLLSAALTEALGLHPLLGAFVFGVVLGQSPRTPPALLNGVQALTIGFVAPIFFVLAGMRVDVVQLGSPTLIGITVLLFLTATVVKVGLGTVATRLVGRTWSESTLVGLGLNLKGGTDVVVAIIGVSLGLLTAKIYTMYAMVAMVTVILSPVVMNWIEQRTPISDEERARLENETAEEQSYTRRVERVLIPVLPELLPEVAASILEPIAESKNRRDQTFDITSLTVDTEKSNTEGAEQAEDALVEAGRLKEVEIRHTHVRGKSKSLDAIVGMAAGYDLVAIGSDGGSGRKGSLGRLQEEVIQHVEADVLLAVDPEHQFDRDKVRCILVPLNGLEYSMAAGDLAASLAQTCDAELVAFNVVQNDVNDMFWRERDRRHLLNAGSSIAEDLSARVGRLGVRVVEQVEVADQPDVRLLEELKTRKYDLVVAGAVNRSRNGKPHLGRTVGTILTKSPVPAVILISNSGTSNRPI